MRADPVLDPVGMPVHDPHPAIIDAQRIGSDLRHHGLKALSDRRAAGHDFDSTLMVDRDRDPIGRTETALLDKDRETGANRFAGPPALPQSSLQRVPSDSGLRLFHQSGIVA